MPKLTSNRTFLCYLIRMGKFILTQIGFECKNQTVTGSKNVAAWVTLVIGVVAFIWSCVTLDEKDVRAVIGNILTAALLLLPTFLAHTTAIKDYSRNNIPVGQSPTPRTPYGNQLVIYGVFVAYTSIAFVFRLCFGEVALWLINFTVIFIEFFSIIIDVLVVLFDAEIKID